MGATKSNLALGELTIGSKEEFVAGDLLDTYLPQTGVAQLPMVMAKSDAYNADTVDCGTDVTVTGCTDGPTVTGPGCGEEPDSVNCPDGPTVTGPNCTDSTASGCSTLAGGATGGTCS